MPTSYYVLDRAYCHREVARFDASEVFGGDGRRRLMAEARAVELNTWDAAQEAALDGTPSAAQTLEDPTPHKEKEASSHGS